jgi:hypothetical protein
MGSSISYKEQLPDRIPIPHEAEVTVPWNDTVELIYTSAPGPSGYIWLFGHGILGDKNKMACILNKRKTVLIYAETAHLYNYLRAFLCMLPYNLKFGDELSIFYENRIIKSIAWFDPKYFEEKKTLRYFLCLVTQIKNMAYMVDEWFQYHRRIGFDHIIIYDNNSTDNIWFMFDSYSDMEIIPWPWRRSQQQAYTHALLFTKSRCVWALFADLDTFIFPRSSTSISEILKNVTMINVAQVGFKVLRMSHDNLVKCPNTSITETYIHRKKLPDAWDQYPFSAVLTSLGLPIHQIHGAPLSQPFESINLHPQIAYGVHYSDRCYEQYYYQKLFGRNGVRDWNIPKNYSITNPIPSWRTLSVNANVKDTEFRDFKRGIDKLGLPAPLLV